MSAVVAVVHNYFHVTWIVPGLCQFINSVYADRKGIRKNYIYVNLITLIIVMFAFVEKKYTYDYLLIASFCAAALNFGIYIVACVLVNYNKEHIAYMRESYENQRKLIDELELESMTGFFNRKALKRELPKENNKNTFIAMIDIDDFKKINDKYGHSNGDEVIYKLVSVVRDITSDDVMPFRYGGEEFIFMFKNSTMDKVVEVMNVLLKRFAECKYSFDSEICVTFSAGVVQCDESMKPEEIIEKVDDALYEAKRSGKNKIEVA